MFIYIYILSNYKLFNLCLSVMLDCLTCSFTSISYLTTSCLICVLRVMLDCLSCSFTSISYLTTSYLFVSKCNVGLSHMFIYIYILSNYKLFNLCLSVMLDCLTCSFTSISYLTTSCLICVLCVMLDCLSCSFTSILSYYKLFNVCLSVMLDYLTCSFTSISYLTTSYLICV